MTQNTNLKNQLWAAAEQLRANGSLKLNEISEPILGLIFLKFADVKFKNLHKDILKQRGNQTGRQRPISSDDYKSQGVVFVPDTASYQYLLSLPESENTGKAINDAISQIEEHNTELKGVLPKNYTSISNNSTENSKLLITLLKNFNQIPDDIEGDAFGDIYEYFLGEFARSEGQGGGEFFTPQSMISLLVEILEPKSGSIFDPACGSGGMFVACANYAKKHTTLDRNIMNEITIYGQEKGEGNIKINKMNLAIHGLSGKVIQANSFYDDPHFSIGKFDYVLANPPFNVKGKDSNGQTVIDGSRIKNDNRYPFGLPLTGKNDITNGNYLWIQMFASSLSPKGRAGFVMANSASDAGNSELQIRKNLIESGIVDCIVSVGTNMFMNATLPCTLWFFDKAKKGTDREKKILFLNAQDIFTQVDRAHNTWTDKQIQELAGYVRSFRGEVGYPVYQDQKGRCKVATIEEVAASGYSLNPGRYVGTVESTITHEDFESSMRELQTEFELLTTESHELEEKIKENFTKLFEK
jgi:type I restriction enzyme M protein